MVFFRNIFGGSSTTKPDSSYKHSSAPTPLSSKHLDYIYASSDSTAPLRPVLSRAPDSYSSVRSQRIPPSPLTPYDSSSLRRNYNPSPDGQPSRSSSQDPRHPYAASHSSIHSAGSSFYASRGNTDQRPPSSRRGSNSSGIEPRPVLKKCRENSSSSMKSGPHAHVSFENPKKQVNRHMHPLFAYGRLHRAPISYDVMFPPSPRTVVDRNTRSPIPSHTLSQPATEPPTPNRLVLKTSKLPWEIVVTPSFSGPPSTRSKFYLGSHSSDSDEAPVITNLDFLHGIHNSLAARVTAQEWDALGKGSRAQRKVTQAYEKRCIAMGGGWEDGVKRVDFLMEKTRLIGVEIDRTANGEIGRLVFADA